MTMLHTWMRVQTGPIDPRARANTFDDAYMASAIRFVSSHEVGHTFGLKHNMGASSSFPVDSLRSKTFTARMGGTASSIMDYARFNYVAQPEDEVERITPVIGVYDKFAINWALSPLDVKIRARRITCTQSMDYETFRRQDVLVRRTTGP